MPRARSFFRVAIAVLCIALSTGCTGAAASRRLQQDLASLLNSVITQQNQGFNNETTPALLSFRDSIPNFDEVTAEKDNFTGWTEEDAANVCDWTGVQCASGAVNNLILSGYGFEGPLNSTWDFSKLIVVTLSNNSFTGTLPTTWGNGWSVQNLDLSDNKISGPLPSDWDQTGNWQFLTQLALGVNKLSGTLPTNWGQNLNLTSFNASYNSFTGSLPTEWGAGNSNQFVGLETLALVKANLSGPIPDTWGTGKGSSAGNGLGALRSFYADYNQLTGTLPASWPANSLSKLSLVTLSQNLLQGTLPASWSALPFATLDLSYNKLDGTLPDQWGESGTWAGLLKLALQNNQLTGYLPIDWGTNGSMSNLQEMALQNNNLSGPIPSQWAEAGRFVRNANDGTATEFIVLPGNDGLCGTYNDDLSTGLQLYSATPSVANATLGGKITSDPTGSARACPPPPPPPVQSPPESPPGSITPSSSSSSSSLSGGAIAGIIIGALAGVLAAALLAFCCCCRRRGRDSEHDKAFAGTDMAKDRASKDSHSRWLSWRSDTSAPISFRSNEARKLNEKSGVGNDHDSDELAPPKGSGSRKQVFEMSGTMTGTGTHSSPTRSLISTQDWAESPAVGRLQLPHSFEWRINPEQLAICKRPDGSDWRLGAGGFGTVYKAVKDDVHDVAMKVFKNEDGVATQTHKFQNEIAIMKGCRDKNIVQFYGACVSEGTLMMVTELMENGDLFSALSDPERAPRLLWNRRGRRIALDVARGLHYLHSNNVIHFDLKSANILLARDDTAKLADVGLSHALVTKTHVVNSVMRGTWSWAAPETITGLRCTEKVDIWSFGIVLWELCTGEQPERGRNRPIRVPQEAPKEIDMLIAMCTDPDPSLRPTAKEIIQHIISATSDKEQPAK